MTAAVCPGSLDPVINGHLDIIKRASEMFDHLTIMVLNNKAKSPLFTTAERVTMLCEITVGIKNIEAESFDGLSIKYCHEKGTQVMVRGLRAVIDFEYELQIAQTNRVIAPDIDTVFLATNLKYSYLSSSIVGGIAACRGGISAFVDNYVATKIMEKYSHSQNCGGGVKA